MRRLTVAGTIAWVSVILNACLGKPLPSTWSPAVVPLTTGDTLVLGAVVPLRADSGLGPMHRYFTADPAAQLGKLLVRYDSTGVVRYIKMFNADPGAGTAIARALRRLYGPPTTEWGDERRVQDWQNRGPWHVRAVYGRKHGTYLRVIEREKDDTEFITHEYGAGLVPPWTARDSVCRRGYWEMCSP